MINGKQCQVAQMSTSKTGKHGSAKVMITGIDIETGQKFEKMLGANEDVVLPESVSESSSDDDDDDDYDEEEEDADFEEEKDSPIQMVQKKLD